MCRLFFLFFQAIKDEKYLDVLKVILNTKPNVINETFDISPDASRQIHRTPYRRFGRQDPPLPRGLLLRQRNNGLFFFRQ